MTQPPVEGTGGGEVHDAARHEEEKLRERLAQQFAHQWEQVREARRQAESVEPVIETGPSNFSRAQVPWGYDLAAAWAWRFLVIVAAGFVVLKFIDFFSVVVFPVVIALFLAALAAPLVRLMQRAGIPRKLAALLVVIAGIAVVALAITFVTQQVSSQAGELSSQVAGGLGEIKDWLQTGPLHLTDSQINDWIEKLQDFVKNRGGDIAGQATELGVTVTHILAGFFIVLFATYFFLADGHMIWAWMVRIFPRAARTRADSSGRVAWTSLVQFVRATVLVAATDAIGIAIIAAILKVPLVTAIGLLVFLGAFVPMIGAFVSGTVAVLVALVAHGPIVALLMFGGVILVQQIEAHVLQPFLMGRFVSVHPLAVILSIAGGVLVAGIPGALVAVPIAAALNAVVQHLATYTDIGESAEHASADDPPRETDAQIQAEVAGEPE
ncbi:AI-2E family transporter [Marmoricola sp. RAF53]|uniref:AI-2E family transporter n=1 Tax=Marmoricola sp. RAF53 TaxID=3233059 RepID=UPI003F97F6B2